MRGKTTNSTTNKNTTHATVTEETALDHVISSVLSRLC